MLLGVLTRRVTPSLPSVLCNICTIIVSLLYKTSNYYLNFDILIRTTFNFNSFKEWSYISWPWFIIQSNWFRRLFHIGHQCNGFTPEPLQQDGERYNPPSPFSLYSSFVSISLLFYIYFRFASPNFIIAIHSIYKRIYFLNND